MVTYGYVRQSARLDGYSEADVIVIETYYIATRKTLCDESRPLLRHINMRQSGDGDEHTLPLHCYYLHYYFFFYEMALLFTNICYDSEY